jgi:S1-C subfamily serine protease
MSEIKGISREVVEGIIKSQVSVFVVDSNGAREGNGVHVGGGLITTARHVIPEPGASNIQVVILDYQDKQIHAQHFWTHENRDLAVIIAPDAIDILASSPINTAIPDVSDTMIVAPYTSRTGQALTRTLSKGLFDPAQASPDLDESILQKLEGTFQIQHSIDPASQSITLNTPGFSGVGVFNLEGELSGIFVGATPTRGSVVPAAEIFNMFPGAKGPIINE